jgi:hypothetical protein
VTALTDGDVAARFAYETVGAAATRDVAYRHALRVDQDEEQTV